VNEQLQVQNVRVKHVKYPPVMPLDSEFYTALPIDVLLTSLSPTYLTCCFRNAVKTFLLRAHGSNSAAHGLWNVTLMEVIYSLADVFLSSGIVCITVSTRPSFLRYALFLCNAFVIL
jgi:hypothetical protein